MSNLWVGEVLGSGAQCWRAGVLFLLRRNLSLTVMTTDSEEVGRRVSVIVLYGTTSFRLTNLYAPNSPTKTYFHELTAWFTANLHKHHFISGNFNTTMLELKDRFGPRSSHASAHAPSIPSLLQTYTEAALLMDI